MKFLEITHEGTSIVKQSKLHMLTSTFEYLRMKEDEQLINFHNKLQYVVNSMRGLGESIPDSKIVRKILRSLSERFHPKVTLVKESKDIDIIKVEELIRSIQTFELKLRPVSKKKGVALKI